MILNGQYGKGGTGGLLPRINVTAPYGSTVTVNGNPTRKASSLPSGYTELTYIESTGTQYIIIPYQVSSAFSRLELSFSGFTAVSSTTQTLLGVELTSSSGSVLTSRLMVRDTSSNVFAWYNIGATGSVDITSGLSSNDNIFIADKSSGKITLNAYSASATINPTTTNPLSLCIFGLNTGTSSSYSVSQLCSYQFKSLKIYDANLVVNLVPCYRNSDSEVGLYDTVNNVFYTNQGSGSFVAGEEVFRYDCPSFGTYSVVGTLNGKTQTKSVVVDACEIYPVTIDYRLYLYNQGDECTALTGGWTGSIYSDGTSSGGGYTKNATNLFVKTYFRTGSYIQAGKFETTNYVDFANYNYLKFKITNKTYTSTPNNPIRIGTYWTSTTMTHLEVTSSQASQDVISIDISSLSEAHKVRVWFWGNTPSGTTITSTATYEQIWLE